MSDSQTYADLEIRILEKQDRGYPVEITFNGDQEFPRGFLDPAAQPPIDQTSPRESGERLFQWLFAADKLKIAWAQARGNRPLRRILLRIDEAAPELHQLPWELLRDIGDTGVPLDLSAIDATPFSRYLAGPWVPGSPILKRPIRVLVAVANPGNLKDFGLSAIDPDAEFQSLQDAVIGNSKIELVKLEGPCTLPALDAALRKGVHVLHFVGHGKYVDGTSVLFLCDPDNPDKASPVKDTEIAAMLGRQLVDSGSQSDDKLRLVYLSSCQTATRSPADAFRGLAPSLVAIGVPAVLAMQDLIPIKTATEFSRAFYTALLDHGQVDRASNTARACVMSANLPGAAIPVLFMRLRSGQLLGNPGKILGPLQESAWKTLLDNIKRKNCTPVLGPGVALGLLPQPDEIAAELASRSIFPFPNPNDLLRVSQVIGTIDDTSLREQMLGILVAGFRKRVGFAANGIDLSLSGAIQQSDWINLGPRLFETEIHRQLAALNLPLYVTTNFDSFMALALQAKGGPARRETITWRTPPGERYDLDAPPTAENPVVMHLFGTDDDMQSMVLTEDDHLDYLANISHDHDNFLPFSVNDRLASTTLLFLGYRLEDLSLKVILRGLLAHLDLGKWNRLQLAVQLESAKQDEATEKEVVDYLQRSIQQYFPRKAPVQIYWGSAQQFMADLTGRWERLGK